MEQFGQLFSPPSGHTRYSPNYLYEEVCCVLVDVFDCVQQGQVKRRNDKSEEDCESCFLHDVGLVQVHLRVKASKLVIPPFDEDLTSKRVICL